MTHVILHPFSQEAANTMLHWAGNKLPETNKSLYGNQALFGLTYSLSA